MKTIILTICGLFFIGLISYAKQNKLDKDIESVWIFKYKDQSDFTTNRLIFNTQDVNDLITLSNAEANQHIGKVTHKRVVMKVIFNPSVNLLNKDELFSVFNVNPRHQGLPLQVDGKLIPDPSKIIAAENAIYSLEVNEQQNTIVIISKDYQKSILRPVRKSTSEIYIK